PGRRSARRRVGRSQGVGSGCRRGSGLPRPALAAPEAAPGRRGGCGGCRRRRSAHPDADARSSRAGGRRRRDRRRLVQLARPERSPSRRGGEVSVWSAVLLAACICAALKAFGYLIPAHLLEAERPARISDLLTVALLAALVAVQSLGA